MKILITLDYELFFGESGTPEKCIIEPTKHLVNIANKYNFKCVFFVDAGYLVKLKKEYLRFPKLREDYELVTSQIKELSDSGHEIQLHIHPHWEDSFYDGNRWIFNLNRFRLSDFEYQDIDRIVYEYKSELEELSGKKVFAYRAGGWCIQPFNKTKDVFIKNGISMDSTVFFNGSNSTKTQWFDFTKAPNKSFWKFDTDPCIENDKGYFTEIPISSVKVSPVFYWKFIFLKFFGKDKYKSYGDGSSSGMSKLQIIKMLLLPSYSVVSMDGFKASLLKRALSERKKNSENDNFVVIGHPKAFSKYSLNEFDDFLASALSKENSIITYKNILDRDK